MTEGDGQIHFWQKYYNSMKVLLKLLMKEISLVRGKFAFSRTCWRVLVHPFVFETYCRCLQTHIYSVIFLLCPEKKDYRTHL